MTQQLILIAGPYRSGTDGLQARIDENLARLENAALAVYQRGHVPVIGEWLALPLAKAAGSTSLGDDIAESMLYPVAHRLIAKCDAIYRIAGASKGRIWTLKWPGTWPHDLYYAGEHSSGLTMTVPVSHLTGS